MLRSLPPPIQKQVVILSNEEPDDEVRQEDGKENGALNELELRARK